MNEDQSQAAIPAGAGISPGRLIGANPGGAGKYGKRGGNNSSGSSNGSTNGSSSYVGDAMVITSRTCWDVSSGVSPLGNLAPPPEVIMAGKARTHQHSRHGDFILPHRLPREWDNRESIRVH